MSARFPGSAVLALLLAAPAAAQGSTTLARYSFDDSVETGPDTFAIWHHGQGRVRLSDAFHVSGYHSLELRDVAGDGAFPELQGYFPVRREGKLYFHFAFLITDAKEELNIALAGPRFFKVEPDGIAFWLGTRDGMLVHNSGGVFEKLLVPETFVWYLADIVYDIDRGVYDLTLRREGQNEPVVALRRQPNAPKGRGSAVDKFSFVGSPFVDTSNVVYYVDDVVIATSQHDAPQGHVAPGRRKLFVDAFAEYQSLLAKKPRCLPVSDFLHDFDLSAKDVAALAQDELQSLLRALVPGTVSDPAPASNGRSARWSQGMSEWNAGCAALDADAPREALSRFDAAAALLPSAPIVALSQALALTGLGRIPEADLRLAQLGGMRDDPRYAVASAYVGIASGDLDRALAWVKDPAARVLDRDVNPFLWLLDPRQWSLERFLALRGGLSEEARRHVEETFVTEQYYFVQLWKHETLRARDYALAMAERLRRGKLPWALWTERAGDACFYRRDLKEAGEHYTAAREADETRIAWLDLKLADVAFLQGDLRAERVLRERYYGALKDR